MPTPLGERVRDLRKKRSLTLEALAKKVGSSKSYMWEIENKDVTRPSAEKLSLIASALDTTTDYLLAGSSENEADADDLVFFRKYKSMRPESKERLRKVLDILDDED